MTSALELCTRLGYPSAGSHGSGGLARTLLDDLKAFVENETAGDDANTMTTMYLREPVRVFRHPYDLTPGGFRSVHEWTDLPRWKLTWVNELLSQLFGLIMQGKGAQHQVIAVEEGHPSVVYPAITPASDIDAGGHDLQALESIISHNDLQEEQSRYLSEMEFQAATVDIAKKEPLATAVEPQSAEASAGLQQMMQGFAVYETNSRIGLIRRLALREPSLIAVLLKAGFTQPFPVTASSEDELESKLDDWMIERPGADPPGSMPADEPKLCKDREDMVNLTLATTSGVGFTRFRRITSSLMILILLDADGECMLVQSEATNDGGRIDYHGWLGSDLGFTTYPTASSDQPESHSIRSSGDLSALTYPAEGTQQEPITQGIIKKEPSLTEVRQATLRRNRMERQTDEQRWRSETPPLSSVSTVKKRRWPPQYVSPPPTPRPKKSYKRRNVGGMQCKAMLYRSSSPEVLDINPLTPPQNLRRSTRAKNALDHALLSPLKTPTTPKRTKGATKKLPKTVKLTSTNNQSLLAGPLAKHDIMLHFFLSNDDLGAVPVALSECDTATVFFNQALSAWNLVGGEDAPGDMTAVSVTIDYFNWPIVLPWGNATAFERMIETITIAKNRKVDDLEVKVKCIKTWLMGRELVSKARKPGLYPESDGKVAKGTAM